MRLFLASESPRRRELLKRVVPEFEVEVSAVDEVSEPGNRTPAELAMFNAGKKADAVACRHPEDWVLGADTVVVLDGRVYGKPRDLAEAAEMLQRFSGRRHEVITALALRHKGSEKSWDEAVSSYVWFRELDREVIADYLSKVPVLDKAGSYGIQEYGDMLVEKIDGELENIIGLPVEALRICLQKLGFGECFTVKKG